MRLIMQIFEAYILIKVILMFTGKKSKSIPAKISFLIRRNIHKRLDQAIMDGSPINDPKVRSLANYKSRKVN